MTFTPRANPGVLHQYAARLVAFEHTPTKSIESQPQHTLIFIAGLSDGLLTVPYARVLAESLPPSFSLCEILLSSSYSGWGTSSVTKDATEIAQCVAYFKKVRPNRKVVLMGHSTGCQDIMEYLVGRGAEGRPPIDGAIIQAPVSDREAMEFIMDPEVSRRSAELAKKMVAEGNGEEIVPSNVTGEIFGTPCCARRWLSLASPDHDGDEDYYSSDLPLERLQSTFGKIPKSSPLCILYSGKDQSVPQGLNKQELVRKWIGIVHDGGGLVDEDSSGIVEGASHNLMGDPEEVVNRLVERVVKYLRRLDNGDLGTLK
ncbi:MAG: hypothetical protein M1835_006202 [Candelina submexicana]|nr:MAG: hypothetical protein M1835_006202 [Candelina submexicana]